MRPTRTHDEQRLYPPKFHQKYYPDAINSAAAIVERLPALAIALADQITVVP
jgi:hypothetical protein